MSLAKVDEKMRPGMAVKVELRRPPLANVVVVPRGAVQFAKDKARVKLAGGELRDVELGPCDAQGCAVTKGLTEGQVVAW
jgi:multidrug efflux pump subunit AcrA (membrane-fusion protein)